MSLGPHGGSGTVYYVPYSGTQDGIHGVSNATSTVKEYSYRTYDVLTVQYGM